MEVITGEDRGVRGKVLKVLPDEGKVVVEGVNRVYKHMRRSQKNPQGGRLSKEMPIDVSNVLLVCRSAASRPASACECRTTAAKERYCNEADAAIGAITAAAKRRQASKQQ